MVWFIIDAFTHLSLELSYVLLALGPTAEKSDSMFAFVWREYARADKRYAHSRLVRSRIGTDVRMAWKEMSHWYLKLRHRWAVRDTTVISLELLTGEPLGI